MKIKLNEKHIKIIFIIFIVIIALTLAIIQPYNAGPDEKMKMDVCKYIADNLKLPHGGDETIRDPSWGISYGFTPVLQYMFAAVFIKIISFFTQNMHVFYIAARVQSVICYALFTVFIMKIGEKLFKNKYIKWDFIVLVTLLPQMVFIGSYINNDSLALLAVAIIIYSWINGLDSNWNIKSCIMLAIGIGLCVLSYYNAYGYILTSIILFVTSFFINKWKKIDKEDIKQLFKKGIIISIITVTICGWWFIRNAIIYEGDFLGLKTTDEYGEKYAIEELKPSNRETPYKMNYSLLYMFTEQAWLSCTVKSFIGVFGGMNIFMPNVFYLAYLAIFLIGIVGYMFKFYKFKHVDELKVDKNKALLEIIFGINIVIPIVLSIYYSYFSDFQPQGRYIMPMVIPFMYFITLGIENLLNKIIKKEQIKKIIICVEILGLIMLLMLCLIKIVRSC